MTPTEVFIDAHSHVWTPDVARYPLAEGFTVADMTPRSFTAEELLATCRPAGVGRVNLIQMSFYGFDNRYLLDMIAKYPTGSSARRSSTRWRRTRSGRWRR